MGVMGFWQWVVVLVIVAMIFGTSKLKNIGKDLGGAVKGFKDGLKEGEEEAKNTANAQQTQQQNITQQNNAAPADDSNVIDVQSKSKS